MHLKIQIIKVISFASLVHLMFFQNIFAQNKIYADSIIAYQQNYVTNHEVLGTNDKKYIHFYKVDKSYRITASLKKISDAKGFEMITSSGKKQKYFQYGLLTFKLHNSVAHLYIYQSASLIQQEKYRDYLFVPFTDATSGFESYGGGRYLDFTLSDIKNNHLVMDFNKAYNPYCAYTSGYDCPVPPKENLLHIAIKAGEKNYDKPIH